MVKKAVVVLARGFEEIEAVTPIDILRRAGIRVIIAGVGSLSVSGSRNIVISADKRIKDVSDDCDVCILPGGMPGALNLAKSKPLESLLKSLNRKRKLIAAICASPAIVLSPLGILDKKHATCYPGMEGHFNKSIKYKKEPVVVDKNIITAWGPSAAIQFSLATAEKLTNKNIRNKLEKALLIL